MGMSDIDPIIQMAGSDEEFAVDVDFYLGSGLILTDGTTEEINTGSDLYSAISTFSIRGGIKVKNDRIPEMFVNPAHIASVRPVRVGVD